MGELPMLDLLKDHGYIFGGNDNGPLWEKRVNGTVVSVLRSCNPWREEWQDVYSGVVYDDIEILRQFLVQPPQPINGKIPVRPHGVRPPPSERTTKEIEQDRQDGLSLARDREWIKQQLHKEQSPITVPVVIKSVAEVLAESIPDRVYRVEDLWPDGGNIVFAGHPKVGKSLATGQLVKALADGGYFLHEQFTVYPPNGRIIWIDTELPEDTFHRNLEKLGIVNQDRVKTICLRGCEQQFDITDPECRAEWVTKFRNHGAGIIVIDCLGPLLTAFNLDPNHEAGKFLYPFNALRNECGATEGGFISHHMGHMGERSKGDSAILAWPDATWKEVLEDYDDAMSDRFFSAFGRSGVSVAESRIWFDSMMDRVSIPTIGDSRKAAKKAIQEASKVESHADTIAKWQAAIRELLSAESSKDGLSKRAIEQGCGGGSKAFREARDRMIIAKEVVAVGRDRWKLATVVTGL